VNTVGWLAQEPEAMASRPRRQELGIAQFFVSEEEGDAVFWGAAVVQPLIFALVGAVLALRRRRG
jgi:hypothetical protein